MHGAQPGTERSRDLERLLTFIDAIAAVAITLLILPLVEIAGDLHSGDDSVSHLLRTHADQFWSFGLSFAVIARLWLAQHQLLRPVVASNQRIVLCLVLWTLAIVFLPFPTALLAKGGSQAITKILYIGCLAASSLFLTLLAIAVRRDPSVHAPNAAPRVRPVALTTVLMLAALAITLVFPATSYYPMFLLMADDAIDAVWSRLTARTDRGRRARPTSGSRSG